MAFFQKITAQLLPSVKVLVVPQIRTFKRWHAPYFQELYRRRQRAGPEPVRPRSAWQWNYKAELYAFGKRLNEELDSSLLRKVFTHSSYITKEEESRKLLGISNAPLQVDSNDELIETGQKVIDDYVLDYLRFSFSRLPEEGIQAIHKYLISVDVLSHVSFNIGTKDLIFCGEFPPTEETLTKTLKAFIGGIAEEKGLNRAEIFVQDFILTQLVGKDVNELWEIINPMGMLIDIFKRDNRELPESRLIRESGRSTIQAVYNVGLYSERKLVGMGAGETLSIAEEMAARDALKRLFNTRMEPILLPLGKLGHQLHLPRNTKNLSVNDWCLKLVNQSLEKTRTANF